MAEQTVESFQKVLGEMLKLRDQILAIQKTVIKAAGAFQEWKRLYVMHTDHKFPTSIVTDPTCPSIDASHWPDGETIARLLVEWRAARDAAEVIWKDLPAEARVGFRKPSEY